MRELASWGCGTDMHVVLLNAPRLDSEDHTKDIDFTAAGIHARWQAGYADMNKALATQPWVSPASPIEGIAIHAI